MNLQNNIGFQTVRDRYGIIMQTWDGNVALKAGWDNERHTVNRGDGIVVLQAGDKIMGFAENGIDWHPGVGGNRYFTIYAEPSRIRVLRPNQTNVFDTLKELLSSAKSVAVFS